MTQPSNPNPLPTLLYEARLSGDELGPLLSMIREQIVKPAQAAGLPFVLHLVGDLGAGKTYFVGQLLYFMGLPRHVPVTSPSFTYLTEYSLAGQYYAHIDAYRSNEAFDWDIQIDARDYAGFFVEWPERFSSLNLHSPFMYCLKIDYPKEGVADRHYQLFKLDQ